MKRLLLGVQSILPKGLVAYWGAYGGLRAILTSHYFFAALGLNLLAYPLWMGPGEWWTLTLGVIPNLLGFSLAGYTFLISFGEERFQKFLIRTRVKSGRSAFMVMNASFVHFVLVQATALILAVAANALKEVAPPSFMTRATASWMQTAGGFLGSLFLMYSLTLIAAATLAVFDVSRVFDSHQKAEYDKDEQRKKRPWPPLD